MDLLSFLCGIVVGSVLTYVALVLIAFLFMER